jgi:hypothetical protein
MTTLELRHTLPIKAVTLRRTPAQGLGDWQFTVLLEEGGERVELRVSLSETQRCIAGVREPSAQWIEGRLQTLARSRLAAGEPVLAQVSAWRQPVPLFAPPR